MTRGRTLPGPGAPRSLPGGGSVPLSGSKSGRAAGAGRGEAKGGKRASKQRKVERPRGPGGQKAAGARGREARQERPAFEVPRPEGDRYRLLRPLLRVLGRAPVALGIAVVILVIAAILIMSHLLRRPSSSGTEPSGNVSRTGGPYSSSA